MTMIDTHDGARTSLLSGEVARRGFFGFAPPVLFTWAAGLFGGIVLGWMIGGQWGLLAGGVFAMLVFLSTFDIRGNGSTGEKLIDRTRERQRRRRGEHVFVGRDDENYGDPMYDPGWEIPVPLGKVAPLDTSGTGLDDLFILGHNNPGEPPYYSTLVSVQGFGEGIRGNAQWAVSSEAFGKLLASLAKRTSFIRGLHMVQRSVPADLTRHKLWYERKVREAGEQTQNPNLLPAVESYGALLDSIGPATEEHRCYIALKFPLSGRLVKRAEELARQKGADTSGGVAQLVRDEAARAISFMRAADMGEIELLGERRTCAVIRAFIDPSFQLDKHRDVDWSNCFPSYVGEDEAVVVNDRWHTRVAFVPPGGISPVELGATWLDELLVGVGPDEGDDETPPSPTIRTISVRADLIPDHKARTAAREDRTDDTAALTREQRKGKIGDGTTAVLEASSARRQEDLMPGSGHHGVVYSMAIAVTAPGEDAIVRACDRVLEAANASSITELEWAERRHDVAMFSTLPLGRGLASHKLTKN